MALTNVSKADYTDMRGTITEYSVPPSATDGVSNAGETTWQSSRWTTDYGYYKAIPELKASIDTLAFWSVGKGFKAGFRAKKTIKRIRGWGKDTFNDLLNNWVKTFILSGDSFSEIIRDKAGRITNLKPLSPDSIKIVVDVQGNIKRYEQTNRQKEVIQKFEVDEILHFCWGRVADEIHGTGIVEAMENIILSRNEAMDDLKLVFHRYVKPLILSKIDSDDATEIAAYKSKLDKSVTLGENLIIPKDTVDLERMSIPQYSTLDPLPWIKYLESFFQMTANVPPIILGKTEDATEAASKMVYLAFQQFIEYIQKFLEDHLDAQTGIKVDVEFPASIEPSLLMDTSKDSNIKGERKSEVSP